MHVFADAAKMHAKQTPFMTIRKGTRLVCNIEEPFDDKFNRTRRKRSRNKLWNMLLG